ncbi:MAG: DUF5979 domain-containing protein, partial [Eubacteriales bacterium]
MSVIPAAPILATGSPDESITQEVTADTTETTAAPTETTAAPTEMATAPPTETAEVPAETTAAPAETTAVPAETPDVVAPEAPIADPWVKSDLADYPAGGLVTLSGAGWTGDIEVVLAIDDISTPTQSWQLIQAVPVAADGSIHFSFLLPTWFVALYQVTATGVTTGRTVTTTFTDTSRDYLQFANEISNESWIGGDLNRNNSDYFEGMSVPQRLVMQGISTGPSSHTASFEFQFTKGGKYAYDFITSWNQAVSAASNIGGQSWSESFKWIGVTPSVVTSLSAFHTTATIPGNAYAAAAARENVYEGALGYGDRVVDVYADAALSNVTVTMDPNLYGSAAGDSSFFFTVTWQGTATKVMILYASHIAVGLDPLPASGIGWGSGLGAGAIDGSPYHNRLAPPSTEWTGASEDNQMKASSVTVKSGLTGMKFFDANGNGLKDPGEIGLAGWTIWVDLDKDGVQDASDPSAVTDANGFYSMYFYLPTQAPTILKVYEVHQSGYTQTYPVTGYQLVTLSPGYEIHFVDFGNKLDKGSLRVTKIIELGNVVGTPAIPDFSITITGLSYPTGNTKVFNAANGLTQTWTNLLPGAYTITETAAGTTWTETVPAGAVTVAANETATASVTNTYVPGALEVTKIIDLADVVGLLTTPDFSITITGPSYPSGDTKVFNELLGLTQTWSNLIPGAYTITESSAGLMWSQTVPAGAVTVAAGATATASVTNTYVPGALQVTKSIVLGTLVGTPVIPDFS